MIKLFTLLNRANATKEALRNPRRAGSEFIKGIFEGYLLVAGLWVALVLGILGLLGFSSIFNGPYEWAEVLFYIALVVIIIGALAVFSLYRFLKKQARALETKIRAQFATPVEVNKPDEPVVVERLSQ